MTLTINNQTVARIEGYAALYNTPDLNGDIIAPGAFSNLFSANFIQHPRSRLMMLYQHKVECPIGCWIDVRSDEKGLFVSGELLLDAPKAREVHALLRGGALDGLSIGFKTVQATNPGPARRIIEQADLWEVSIVSFPMARDARITFVGDAVVKAPDNPERAGLCTQTARRAPFPPSGARHFVDALRGATNILTQ